MNSQSSLFICALLALALLTTTTSASRRRPSHAPVTKEVGSTNANAPAAPVGGANINTQGQILDITHQYYPDQPSWGSDKGLGQIIFPVTDMKNGSLTNNSELRMLVHSGTHVDAPSHVYANYFNLGYGADTLDLNVLNGPAILVDVPRDTNITADCMKQLNIPRGVRRVLFRTANTDKHLMNKKEFDWSYVGFVSDGAQWLVDNTDIKLVGLDYLSVAASTDIILTHHIFLKNRDIVLVEGLKLVNVLPGVTYNIHCLPLKIKADGSPTRCILIKP